MTDLASTPVLEVGQLYAGYRRDWSVLQDVNLSIRKGQIVVILGSNGAGKSTLLRVIAGLLAVQAGSVCLEGRDLRALRASQRVAQGINLVPEDRGIFVGMTVDENLRAGAFSRRRLLGSHGVRQRMDEVLEIFPELLRRSEQEAGSLSGGERVMLAVARALMGSPRLLLLDEPSLGLAPLARKRLFDAVMAMSRDLAVTVVVAEQDVTNALRVASYVYCLRAGIIVEQGEAERFADLSLLRGVYTANAPDRLSNTSEWGMG